MSEEYVVRDDEVDLMHDVRSDMSLEDLINAKITELVQLAQEQNRELQNLIDFVLYGHSYSAVIIYANNLRHRLMEEK